MDDNTKDVLIAVVQVGGGLLSGYVLARFTIGRGDKIELERWRREDRHRYTASR